VLSDIVCAMRILESRKFAIALALLALLVSGEGVAAQRNVVVVRPKEIQDVLVNPGMGITTFQ